MKDAIEQAARALASLDDQSEFAPIDGAPVWRDYLLQVRAVLEAMRVPSEAVLDAGMCSLQQWEAMIEAALEQCER